MKRTYAREKERLLRSLIRHGLTAVLLLAVAASSLTAGQDTGEAATETSTPPDQLLLKDYRPRSIYKIPQTRVERTRFPVIDMHSHPYARTPEQVEQWVRNMDAVGIAKTIIMVGATGKTFDDAVALFQKYPSRFEMWCGLDYTGFDQPGFAEHAIAELERCVKAGARGVGELSDKGRGLSRGRGNANTLWTPITTA